MCLAQGPQHSDASEVRTLASRSRVRHSTTEPLRSPYSYIRDVKCCILFKVTVTLTSGLSSWKIISTTYLLNYLRKQSQTSTLDASWRDWRLQRTICRWHWPPQSISPILYDKELPNLVCGYIFGPQCVNNCVRVTMTLTSVFSSE